jgi:hypothetical protein
MDTVRSWPAQFGGIGDPRLMAFPAAGRPRRRGRDLVGLAAVLASILVGEQISGQDPSAGTSFRCRP